jgi:NAD+ synthase (glutamine-hydrolysing)
MRIALAQINPTVGDLKGNSDRMLAATRQARARGADLVVLPELCVTGYPPQDLLDAQDFLDDAQAAADRFVADAPPGIGIVFGLPVRAQSERGKRLVNAAFVAEGGRIVGRADKQLLPTYDVFDEARYFAPAGPQAPVEWRGLRLGLHVCEDMWDQEPWGEAGGPLHHHYHADPVGHLGAQGVDLFVNISASPFTSGKPAMRDVLIQTACARWNVPFVLVGQVGANTELIFDGDSRAHRADGSALVRAPLFEESLVLADLDDLRAPAPASPRQHPPRDRIRDLHDALVLGARDYVRKTPIFEGVLIGLSGGIDSALTAALAVEALGADRVWGVTLPSKYSSGGSVSDSRALADALGIRYDEVSIADTVAAFETTLAPIEGGIDGLAEENLQSRTRGVVLMALANQHNRLLLATGNKSEMAVGYATLYGDMNGGLAVLSDVFKTDVYRLARYVNARAGRELIPQATIDKPPSAELRPDQKDEDSLPPYDVLDAILARYVERRQSAERIADATGYDLALVRDVIGKVDRNEFKRRQAAPGLRVTGKAFGAGRRHPIVMRRTRAQQ